MLDVSFKCDNMPQPDNMTHYVQMYRSFLQPEM